MLIPKSALNIFTHYQPQVTSDLQSEACVCVKLQLYIILNILCLKTVLPFS